MTTRTNDSRDGATIKVVANYFHAELSDPDAQSRNEILGTIRELNMAAQQSPKSSHLPDFFLKAEGAGDNFVEVAAAATVKTQQPEFDLIRI